jgi:Domain of unknown function (DUF4410)
VTFKSAISDHYYEEICKPGGTKKMSRALSNISLCILTVLVLGLVSETGAQKDDVPKNKYQNIEVGNFDVDQGIEFPADYKKSLPDAIASKLKSLKKFKQVLQVGEAPSDPNAPVLQLVGTVIDYKPGSQTKRYLVGFGTGKTKIIVHAKFIDKTSGQVVLERDVQGKIEWGLFGGSSKNALNGVGKEIAEVAKKKFF